MSGYFLAPRFAWGPGAIEQLSALAARSAVLLLDPSVAAVHGERRLVEELAKTDTTTTVVVATSGPPTVTEVGRLAESLRPHPTDWIVAVGGGRVLDAAKAVRLSLGYPELDLGRMPPLLDDPTTAPPGLVGVPTTSGSGSEASWSSDLRNADGDPLEVAARSMTPEWALVDPGFAATLTPEQLVDGAAECLALAVESFLSAWANPFSDALALEAATTVVRRLPHAVRWSDDPDARAALHVAAGAAGLAASNAQRGLAHALARALERPTGLPYGRLIGIALPTVLEFDHPAARDRIETLSRSVASPEERGSVALAPRMRRLFDQLRFPATVRAAGVRLPDWPDQRPRAVADTMRSPAVLANPRVASTEEVGGLLDALVGT